MPQGKNPADDKGLENLSVNSARRSGTREDGVGNPARAEAGKSSTESAKVPDQQRPRTLTETDPKPRD